MRGSLRYRGGSLGNHGERAHERRLVPVTGLATDQSILTQPARRRLPRRHRPIDDIRPMTPRFTRPFTHVNGCYRPRQLRPRAVCQRLNAYLQRASSSVAGQACTPYCRTVTGRRQQCHRWREIAARARRSGSLRPRRGNATARTAKRATISVPWLLLSATAVGQMQRRRLSTRTTGLPAIAFARGVPRTARSQRRPNVISRWRGANPQRASGPVPHGDCPGFCRANAIARRLVTA
jgi:hypothetical protein